MVGTGSVCEINVHATNQALPQYGQTKEVQARRASSVSEVVWTHLLALRACSEACLLGGVFVWILTHRFSINDRNAPFNRGGRLFTGYSFFHAQCLVIIDLHRRRVVTLLLQEMFHPSQHPQVVIET